MGKVRRCFVFEIVFLAIDRLEGFHSGGPCSHARDTGSNPVGTAKKKQGVSRIGWPPILCFETISETI